MKNRFLCLMLTVLASCTMTNTRPPEISLVDLQFRDMTFFETTALVTVRVDNQSPEPLAISGASYDIEINGVRIGRGTSDESITVPRLGSATQQVKVHLSNLSVISNIRPMIERRDFEYRIEGTLYRPGSLGLFGTDVEAHHRFELPIDELSGGRAGSARFNQPLRQ